MALRYDYWPFTVRSDNSRRRWEQDLLILWLSCGPNPGNRYGRFSTGAFLSRLPHYSCMSVRHSDSQTGLQKHAPVSQPWLHKLNSSEVLLDTSNPPSENTQPTSHCEVQSVRQNSCASYMYRRVYSFQLQGSASALLAHIAVAKSWT